MIKLIVHPIEFEKQWSGLTIEWVAGWGKKWIIFKKFTKGTDCATWLFSGNELNVFSKL